MPVKPRMKIITGDITKLDVDAIVNAANAALSDGAGVNGAIHRAAGPGLARECRKLGGCETGDAKISGGHDLPARHVIHAVGPVWTGGEKGEPELLASCYRRALEIAHEHDLDTIAFPAISTGIFGYPKDKAAQTAVETVAAFLHNSQRPREVIFCCFDAECADLHEKALAALSS